MGNIAGELVRLYDDKYIASTLHKWGRQKTTRLGTKFICHRPEFRHVIYHVNHSRGIQNATGTTYSDHLWARERHGNPHRDEIYNTTKPIIKQRRKKTRTLLKNYQVMQKHRHHPPNVSS